MSQGRGSISERIRRALYVLSRGRCYAPNCDEPVLVIDRDEVVFVGQVAHIVAASVSGPRGAAGTANTEAFKNLLVLCGRHHAIIDGAETRGHYPASELRKWKKARESGFDEQTLADLHAIRVSATQLKTMFVRSFKETAAELKATVVQLESAGAIAQGAAELLRDSAAALPEIDHSAQLLMFFADVVPSFDRSAAHLQHFTDVVPGFPAAAEQLSEFTQFAPDLNRSAEVLARQGPAISQAATSLEHAAGQITSPRVDELISRLEQAVDRLPASGAVLREPRPAAPPARSTSSSVMPQDLKEFAQAVGVTGLVGLIVGVIATWLIAAHLANGTEQDRQACTGASQPADFVVQRQVEVEVSGTPTHSPSPFVCDTWYPPPISRAD